MDTEAILGNIDFDRIDKHPNILIAARLWDDRRYHAARVCYKFMRMIDDFIDDRKATGKEIGCIERLELSQQVHHWIECLDGTADEDPFFAELARTLEEFRIPLRLFHTFARSMLYDIDNDGFPTLEGFLDYSEGASVAPASVFVHLCCLSEIDGHYEPPAFDVMEAARPCAIFSYLVHIIRDFQEDQLHNLNYFAGDILEKYGLTGPDLKAIAHGNPVPDSFRRMIKTYLDLAGEYRQRTHAVLEQLESHIGERYFLSLRVIYGLYDMVFQKINPEQGSFTAAELNPTRVEIMEKVTELVLSPVLTSSPGPGSGS